MNSSEDAPALARSGRAITAPQVGRNTLHALKAVLIIGRITPPSRRSEAVLAFIFILLGVLAAGFLVLGGIGGFKFPWIQFYVKGKESGFKFSEIGLLRVAARSAKLKDPTTLFWSERALDRCIAAVIRSQAKSSIPNDRQTEFIGRLFEFRKRVEFNLPKYRLGLTSTRTVAAGQVIKLTASDGTLYTARIMENLRKYLVISYPEGGKAGAATNWKNQLVKVYFWRQEDAGYYFESKILGDYSDRQLPYLHLLHSDSLIRTQKRNSIRVGIRQEGYIAPIRSQLEANEKALGIENALRCQMVDLSESGAGILVGGRAKPGFLLKLQTRLYGLPIILCGTVKSVTYNASRHQSLLHVEAFPPSRLMQNRILAYVYGIFQPREGEDMPAVTQVDQQDHGDLGAQSGGDKQMEAGTRASDLPDFEDEMPNIFDSPEKTPDKGIGNQG